MKRIARRLSFILAVGFVAALTSCASIVGDDCGTDSDCGSGLLCDTSLPQGYCTRPDCAIEGCPDEGVCISFDADTSYCMKPCKGGSDCRGGYECVADYGSYPFCAASPLESDSGD